MIIGVVGHTHDPHGSDQGFFQFACCLLSKRGPFLDVLSLPQVESEPSHLRALRMPGGLGRGS